MEDEEAPFGDIALIGASSRVEHYEIAGYSAVIEIGKGLGEDEAVELLNETLEEEKVASETLSTKAVELIQQAAQGPSEDGEEEADDKDASTPKKTARRSKPTTNKKKA